MCVLINCLIIGSLEPVTKYMLFANSNYCFLNHSDELITLMFVILAKSGMHVYLSPHRASSRVLVVIFLYCA